WAKDRVLVTLPCVGLRFSILVGLASLASLGESRDREPQGAKRAWSMDRILNRRERLRQIVRSNNVDALLVSSPTNVSYLTGFTGDSSVLIIGVDRELIVSDGRFTTQLEQECPELEASIRMPGQEMNPAIAHVIETLGIKRLAFEAGVLTVSDHLALADALRGVSMVG